MTKAPAYYFTPGPAPLDPEVLRQAQAAICPKEGPSILSLSHRSKAFKNTLEAIEQKCLQLMGLSDKNYEVLILSGGASTQFAAIPLNLLENKQATSAYFITGHWSQKAFEQAKAYSSPLAIEARSEPLAIPNTAQYVHQCINETIEGIFTPALPNLPIPLIGDASSMLLGQKLDHQAFDILYACCQKNLGIAGTTLVVIKKSLLETCSNRAPKTLQYQTQAHYQSGYNTPDTFSAYVCKIVLEWIEQSGGLDYFDQQNKQKAQLLYDYIDQSDFLYNKVPKAQRSIMNIPFHTKDAHGQAPLLNHLQDHGIYDIQGHRSIGGFRASLYNAITLEAVEHLITALESFKEKHG